ncbi:nose resistant to fluoxetine protein 6-like [Planococcus citri]|uniref:nose resistant to fluoxetine protein 6-like n=1 Tax=Planococcus citri TaxID=170843 RepID=UPI0031F7D132
MDRRVTTLTYFFIVYSLFCAVALENNTEKDVRKIIESENELPSNEHVEPESVQNAKSDFPQRKWISQLFYEAEMAFQMDSNANAECKRDFDLYKLHLRNQSVWAVRMMESSEWPSVGIFSGMVAHLGNYDECLKISSYGVKGQYCLAEVDYDYPDVSLSELVEVPDEKRSAWEALTMYQKNPVRVDRTKLSFAMCIPSSCKSTDLKISLNSTLYPVFTDHGLNVSVDVNPTFCKIQKEFTYSQGYFTVRWFFVILFLLVISSTCYDIAMYASSDEIKKSKPSGALRDIFKAFSIVRNFRKLKKVNPKTDYAPLHFIKILNILFVIYGHRFIYFIGFPKFNAEGAEQHYTSSSIELIHTNVVDVFFMASGFLTFHFGFLPMMKGGGFYLFFSILFRWIRMVPVFGILVLYIIYILPYTSEGPMWDYRIMNEVTKCQESWWANLLVINNIVKTDQQCLLISWYISADIQLAIIGGILLYIFTKNRKIGIFAIFFALMVFAAITFTVAYINQFHGILRLYMSLLEEPRKEYEFTNFYVATYTRAGPYLIGILAGLVIKILKDREFRFSEKQIYLVSFLSILISEGSQYYGCLFYDFNRQYDRFESALYAAVNRSLFVFTYAVHIALYFTSGLGIFNKFFEWKVWVPFGRLTYSVFLVNTVIQLYHASSQKQPMPLSSKMNLVWWALGDVMWCYIIGLVLHLFAEAPISNLSKLLQRHLLKSFVKPKTDECIEKIDSNVEANETKTEKISDVISSSNGTCPPYGYHNECYINNEIIPKISESSKF